MKVGIFGLGSMGSAIMQGLKKTFPDKKFWLSSRGRKNLELFPNENILSDPNQLVDEVDVIILAVKPNSFEGLVKSITVDMSNKLFISVMAGTPLDKITELTKSNRVIRSMPNLPVSVGKGVVAWLGKDIKDSDKQIIIEILSALGVQMEIDTEKLLDAMTPISGSGPAYFYYLCELLTKKAIDLGFSKNEARILAENTFIGSAELFAQDKRDPQEWICAVASKGGSTQEALKVFENSDFDEIFFQAIDAAKEKLKDL